MPSVALTRKSCTFAPMPVVPSMIVDAAPSPTNLRTFDTAIVAPSEYLPAQMWIVWIVSSVAAAVTAGWIVA